MKYRFVPTKTLTATLGEEFTFQSFGKCRRVKFIKTTRKGFNLLDVDTNKCVCRKHFYARKYSHKNIPHNVKKFTVSIPNWLLLEKL